MGVRELSWVVVHFSSYHADWLLRFIAERYKSSTLWGSKNIVVVFAGDCNVSYLADMFNIWAINTVLILVSPEASCQHAFAFR